MKLTSKEEKALEYISENHEAEYCNDYGEPGYTKVSDKQIIFCNWNDVPDGLSKWLEKCGFSIEWSDEWYIDHNHSKAYRTESNSYSWEPSILWHDGNGEYLTPDDSAAEWIEYCAIDSKNSPIFNCLPSWISADNILACGLELQETGLESGWFPGQDADTKKIAKSLFSDGAKRVLFQKSENSQFYCRFMVWIEK